MMLHVWCSIVDALTASLHMPQQPLLGLEQLMFMPAYMHFQNRTLEACSRTAHLQALVVRVLAGWLVLVVAAVAEAVLAVLAGEQLQEEWA
jgi:uncharacterized membrane protein